MKVLASTCVPGDIGVSVGMGTFLLSRARCGVDGTLQWVPLREFTSLSEAFEEARRAAFSSRRRAWFRAGPFGVSLDFQAAA
jgi:hypothetical protein